MVIIILFFRQKLPLLYGQVKQYIFEELAREFNDCELRDSKCELADVIPSESQFLLLAEVQPILDSFLKVSKAFSADKHHLSSCLQPTGQPSDEAKLHCSIRHTICHKRLYPNSDWCAE